MIYDWIIIGAGASGLFAGATAPANNKILILNKAKKPGLKLLMTGSGKCNLTNSGDIKDFVNHYGKQGKRIRTILYGFNNISVIEFFENNGIPVLSRDDGKVFPASMNSKDILDILLKKCGQKGIEIKNDHCVTDIVPQESDPSHKSFQIYCGDKIFTSYKVLIAVGACSYPSTGSDGSLLPVIHKLGISVKEPKPALTSVSVQEYPYSKLAGYSVEKAEIKISGRDIPEIKATGPLLFTHKNFSGPIILDLSRFVDPGQTLTINYFPGKSVDMITKDISVIYSKAGLGKRESLTVFLEYFKPLSKGFLHLLCELTAIDPSAAFSSLKKSEIYDYAKIITSDTFSISGTDGYKNAMATIGGVSLDEVRIKTLEAKKISGLYFSGEVLDVDGDTGGYNLQFAFSSGRLAIGQ